MHVYKAGCWQIRTLQFANDITPILQSVTQRACLLTHLCEKAIFTLVPASCNSLDHGLDQVVDEVLPVAVVATLNVMQPLLVHATLYGKTHQTIIANHGMSINMKQPMHITYSMETHQTISQSWHEYRQQQAEHITYTADAVISHSGVMQQD